MATNSQDGYLYLTYLEEYNRPTQIPKRFTKYLEKFNQLCTLILGAYVCNVDLMGGLAHYGQEDATTLGNSWTRRPKELRASPEVEAESRRRPLRNLLACLAPRLSRRRSSWWRRLRCGWLTYAILLVYLAINVILIINIAHLYKFNVARLRLMRVRELTRAHGPEARLAFDDWSLVQQLMAGAVNSTSDVTATPRRRTLALSQFERLLEIKMDQERHLLTWLGDKFINWGILNGCMYLYPILLTACLYLITQWVYMYSNRPDLQLWRDNIDYAGERRRVDACCESELLKYLESNRNHANLVRESILALNSSTRRRQQPQQVDDSRRLQRRLLAAQRTSDLRASTLLRQMFTAGALRPLNRANLWIERRNLAQSALLCNIIAYCLLFDACVLYASYKGSALAADASSSSRRYRYDLGEMCVLLLILLVDCAIIHYFTSLVVACLDQAALVNRILALIYECIRLNEREFRNQSSPCAGRGQEQHENPTSMVDKINSNYLFALLTYKIFVAQLVPIRRTLRNVFLVASSVSFIVPVLTRIHVPYLEHDQTGSPRQMRLIGLLISSVILLPVNSVCLPLCYLHSRCQKLYKALSSLMAHIAQVRQFGGGGGGGGSAIYNEHAVNVLAKELSNPKQMLEQFVVQSLWGGGTFPTLVKLHFWWGFVALSILIDTHGGGATDGRHLPKDEFFSSFLGDPLGVWCFHVVQNKK